MTSRIRSEVLGRYWRRLHFVFSLVQRVPERPQWQAVCRDFTTSPPVRPRRVATHNALSEAPRQVAHDQRADLPRVIRPDVANLRQPNQSIGPLARDVDRQG